MNNKDIAFTGIWAIFPSHPFPTGGFHPQRLKEAKKVAMRGLKMHPDLTVLHFNIACYDALLGKFRSARKRLHRAIKQNPRVQDFTLNDPDLVRLQDWCRTVKV